MASDESSVRVAVRIRPQTAAEVVEGCAVCARAGGAAGAEGGVVLGDDRAFTFDFAFPPDSSQQLVYDACVRKLVEATLDGYNATVLAYGQTGSGKTYTMGSGWEGEGEDSEGDGAARGVIPRAIRDLFDGARARAEAARAAGHLPPEFSVQAQFIELYNEDIVDLLDPAKDPYAKGALRITEDGCGGVRVVGASMRAVRGAAEALGALRAGARARSTAATNMNSSSSRSHAVFTLLMRQRRLAPSDQDDEREAAGDAEPEAEPADQYETLTAKFHFVDLAGSERLKRTGATGDRAKEGISINCGLLALGNVISALGDKARRALHVPYRDSKLTRLLQDSLGGNSNTVMIACVSPSDRDFMETLNTLKYANRARNIRNRCVVNQDLTSRTIHRLRQTVARLQQELDEYKQGKRVMSENGEEGWSDVVQENAILTGEVEALRRRVKAMQAAIDGLRARTAQLQAERALASWAPAPGPGPPGAAPQAADCSLTQLVQGYVNEIEELRAQLMEATALQQRPPRPPRPSRPPRAPALIDDAKRELYKEKELLARSMGEMEFQRKLNMSESMTSAIDERPIGERAEAEGESDSESEPSDSGDEAEPTEEEGSGALSAQLAALSEDIDTKARLIAQLEASERRLAALRAHYDARLDTLHAQIKAAAAERDRVLADLQSQASPPADQLKRVRSEYERKVSGMARELRRLQAAQREHTRLQRAQAQQAAQLAQLRAQLGDMKRDKVKLVQRMRTEAKRYAQAEAARAKEVAQLRKESRKNANIIRSLEAETKLKEQVLKRKQEEVSLLRRSHRDRLSGMAAGRLRDGDESERAGREVWAALNEWLTRCAATRCTLAQLEGTLTAQLAAREAARDQPAARLALQRAIAHTQQQIMQLEEADEAEEALGAALGARVRSVRAARYVLQRVCARALHAAADAARAHHALHHARAAHDDVPAPAERLAAAFAHVSSGTSTRSVSPADSRDLEDVPSPQDSPSPFQRNLERRGSVRLRDLGVVPLCDMTQSLREPSPAAPRPAPLSRVPSAPGGLRGLLPVSSPLPARRTLPPADTTRPAHHSLEGGACALEPAVGAGAGGGRTPPASPGAARRARDHDVFLRLAGAGARAASDLAPPGTVREIAGKRNSGGGAEGGAGAGGGGGAWLQCTHVAEGHSGAALALLAAGTLLYSGGADGTVRGWDMCVGREAWRGAAGGAAGALAGAGGGAHCVLAAAGAAVRLFDTRSGPQPVHTMWSSGVTGVAGAAGGETAVTALAVAQAQRLYAAAGDKVRLWDLRRLECLCKAWSGHAAPVMCLAVAGGGGGAGGEVLVSGSKDHCVRTMQLTQADGVWECGARRLLEPPHYDGVQALAVAEGGEGGGGEHTLYSASRDSALKRWTLPARSRPAQLTHSVMNAHKGWVTGVTCVGGGEEAGPCVASCGRDGGLRVWSPALRPLAAARLPAPALALQAAPAPLRPLLYTAGSGGDVRAWRLHSDPSQ